MTKSGLTTQIRENQSHNWFLYIFFLHFCSFRWQSFVPFLYATYTLDIHPPLILHTTHSHAIQLLPPPLSLFEKLNYTHPNASVSSLSFSRSRIVKLNLLLLSCEPGCRLFLFSFFSSSHNFLPLFSLYYLSFLFCFVFLRHPFVCSLL